MERFTLIETPIRDSFAESLQAGLDARPRRISPRWFYDARGTELFDRICALPEYYVTRTEAAILERCVRELPAADTVIEFGGGTGAKTRLVLDALRPAAYVPVDISRAALEAVRPLLAAYPGLTVNAIQAEYDRAFELIPRGPSLVLFLGSNIGNFDHAESVRFLSALRGRRALVGFDRVKDAAVLHAAYNDAQGVTAAFNLNVLARANRELGATFDLAQWGHLSFYSERESRIEMHLVSKRPQEVRVDRRTYAFDAGERIHTENSYKFTTEGIASIARESGFRIERAWADERGWFSVVLLS